MKQVRYRILPVLVGLLLIGALVYAFLPQPQDVSVERIKRGPIAVMVREDGKTRIKERYVVSAPLAGKLERSPWHAGDLVTEDKDVLAVIAPSDPDLLDPRARAQAEAKVRAAEALKSQTEAQLQRAKVNQEFAKTTFDRLSKLFAQNGISQQDVDDAEQKALSTNNALKEAEFAAQVAEFELEQARAVLTRAGSGDPGAAKDWRYEIKAPISGRVLKVMQESATVVSPGTKLIEIGNPHDLEIEVDVLSTDAVRIKAGARVQIDHWGGPNLLEGRVRTIEPAAFTKVSALGVEEQRVNVIVDFTSPPEERTALGDGFRVETGIVTWESPDALLVPVSALFRHEDTWAVFVMDHGIATLRPVRTGQSNDLAAEVLEGLQPGEAVIIYPGDKISDGVKVRVR